MLWYPGPQGEHRPERPLTGQRHRPDQPRRPATPGRIPLRGSARDRPPRPRPAPTRHRRRPAAQPANPLTVTVLARIRDARPRRPTAGTGRRAAPRATSGVLPRRPRHRRTNTIHVGIVHAGHTLTVESADTTWQVHDADGLVAEVARTSTEPVTRFKVHKPEPPGQAARQPHHPTRPPGRTTPPASPSPHRVT